MIFLTVGAQMPFDRLARVVDDWADETGRDDVFAQIGRTRWRPRHMHWTRRLTAEEFRSRVFEADTIITHAGMGTILTALEFGRPILVYPRRRVHRETRNDHQVDTARRFERDGRVTVAWSTADLVQSLATLDAIAPNLRIPSHASPRLLTTIRRFIEEGQPDETASDELDIAPTVPVHESDERELRRRAA